jgi:hypothetical protein
MDAFRVIAATFCVAAGAFLFSSAPALAALETPENEVVTAVTATTAHVSGVLNPNASSGVEGGFYGFLYGVSEPAACGEERLVPEPFEEAGIAAGLPKEEESIELTGLQPHAKYTVCLLELNTARTELVMGAPVPFETKAAPPSVISESAPTPKADEARLKAVVDPNNESTECHFQYGEASVAEHSEECEQGNSLEGGEQGVGLTVPGLAQNTTYHYRVVVKNATGEKEGEEQEFTTAITPETPEGLEGEPSASAVKLKGVLNANSPGNPGTYEFLYKQSATECAGGAATPAEPSTGAKKELVKGEVTGLLPNTEYTFCLRAENAAEETAVGPAVTIRTLVAAPAITEEHVTEVTSDSAKLHAAVNPGGAETTYHFDYGTTEAYGQSTPESPSIGSDGTAHPALAEIQGLQPDTTYHYLIVATNELKTVDGLDQTFTTQPSAASGIVLPDGRAWELVSPTETLGAQVIPTNRALSQASEDGDAISYYLSTAFVAKPAGNVEVAQAISKRGPSGWSTEDIATPHDGPITPSNHRYGEYMFFSPDLSHALVQPFGETPLSSEATEGTPYVRDDTAGGYTPVVTPGDVLPGTEFGDEHENGAQATFVTASPDLSHVVLSAGNALTDEQAHFESRENDRLYYEWAGGQLRLISALPPGSNQPEEVHVGGRANTRRAVSSNGSRVFWSTTEPNHVYMTDMTDGEVVRLDKAQGVAEPSNNRSEYQIASSDGSLVFFRDGLQLTATPGGGLYAYNVETGKLTLVTVPVHGNDEFTGSVLGSSEDGSYVYLMDRGVLSEAPNAEQKKALEGGANLYVLHREVLGSAEVWTPSFITSLSTDDANDWQSASESPLGESSQQTVEVSRNGQYLAFMSDRRLTGYDNRDASSGEPDEEVYRYDAAGARLVCASCNPTGARPSGWREPGGSQLPLSDLTRAWVGRWVAATIPGLTETGERANAYSNLSPYEPTYLTDSGRLFFDSRDALVPQAVNGVGDVYEYEPGGAGSCAAGGGCVALLSGGTGPDESAFVDASVSGDDVFFVTTERLVTQDVGTAYAMYDAHVCSAEAPCPSSSAVASPPCTTAESCRAAVLPQPGVFGAPPSATFNGAGNLAPTPAATVKPRAKPLTRAQKLAKTLKACGEKPKRKRAACRQQARKRYGPIHKAKKTGRRGQS